MTGLRFLPPDPSAREGDALVSFHGGSWMVGSAETHKVPNAWLARLAGLPVWAADYRLAREHPCPCQRADGVRAVEAAIGTGARRIVIAGDSAGAEVSFWTAAALPSAAHTCVAGIGAFRNTARESSESACVDVH